MGVDLFLGEVSTKNDLHLQLPKKITTENTNKELLIFE